MFVIRAAVESKTDLALEFKYQKCVVGFVIFPFLLERDRLLDSAQAPGPGLLGRCSSQTKVKNST